MGKFTENFMVANDRKRVQNIDQIINDCSRRSIEKMRSFLGEGYPLHSYCHGTENQGG